MNPWHFSVQKRTWSLLFTTFCVQSVCMAQVNEPVLSLAHDSLWQHDPHMTWRLRVQSKTSVLSILTSPCLLSCNWTIKRESSSKFNKQAINWKLTVKSNSTPITLHAIFTVRVLELKWVLVNEYATPGSYSVSFLPLLPSYYTAKLLEWWPRLDTLFTSVQQARTYLGYANHHLFKSCTTCLVAWCLNLVVALPSFSVVGVNIFLCLPGR